MTTTNLADLAATNPQPILNHYHHPDLDLHLNAIRTLDTRTLPPQLLTDLRDKAGIDLLDIKAMMVEGMTDTDIVTLVHDSNHIAQSHTPHELYADLGNQDEATFLKDFVGTPHPFDPDRIHQANNRLAVTYGWEPNAPGVMPLTTPMSTLLTAVSTGVPYSVLHAPTIRGNLAIYVPHDEGKSPEWSSDFTIERGEYDSAITFSDTSVATFLHVTELWSDRVLVLLTLTDGVEREDAYQPGVRCAHYWRSGFVMFPECLIGLGREDLQEVWGDVVETDGVEHWVSLNGCIIRIN